MRKYIGLIVLIFYSCISTTNDKATLVDKTAVFPEDLEVIYGKFDKEIINTSDNKPLILIYINGNCYDCINELNSWEKYMQNEKFGGNLNFIFFTDVFDEKSFIKIVSENTIFKHPIYRDKSESFWKLNNIPILKKSKVYIILKKRIVYEGNPFSNEGDTKAFEWKLTELTK